jgi:hypothetical protein
VAALVTPHYIPPVTDRQNHTALETIQMAKIRLGTKLAVASATVAVAAAIAISLAPRANAEAPEVLMYTTPT